MTLPKEDDECIAFMEIVAYQFPQIADIFYHIPNGGSRHVVEAKKLKRMGVKKGTPDYHLPIPRGQYASCYIEMKRQEGGRLSADQKRIIARLRQVGNYVGVARGADEALAILRMYMKL
jgi:VRR-NUC domain